MKRPALRNEANLRSALNPLFGGTAKVGCVGDRARREASFLCQGAAAGEIRAGFRQAVHGSEGSIIAPDAMKEMLVKHADDRIVLASTGCTAGCDVFIVAFRTSSGNEPRAVYLAFDNAAGGPVFIGAGVSGDNATTILEGGDTPTLAGETRFTAWSAA